MSSFAGIRGHDSAKARIRSALAGDHLAHALLFTGPEGVGKQRLARSLAAFFVCEKTGQEPNEVCGQCAGCRHFAAGNHPDMRVVTVPNGKREIRIEPIRELRAFLQLAPLRARRKVALILEAHGLNVNAQNALLKTLEEPPPSSLLLLVTHVPGALLPTVRSRCQLVACAPLADDLVIDVLQQECGLAAEEAVVACACAEGSPGRALQLCSALGAGRRSLLARLADLRTGGYVHMAHMIREVTASDEAASALALMLTWFRDQAVRAVGGEAVGLRNADLGEMLPAADAPGAIRRAEVVTETLARLRRGNFNRQLLLEAMFLRIR